jgi:hypothetical protein
MATEFAGHTLGEAERYEDVDRRRCFGLLSLHAPRYVNATGCEKVLHDRELGRELTSDRSDQYEREYVVASWLPVGALGTWTHAGSYREVLDAMVRTPDAAPSPLDVLPAHLIPPSVRALLTAWEAEDRATARAAKRSTHGSPSGRQRRARPDVAARNRARAAARKETRRDDELCDETSLIRATECTRAVGDRRIGRGSLFVTASPMTRPAMLPGD